MVKEFRIETIVKKSESPCIISLNKQHHLIGDLARALGGYIRKGMRVQATGYFKGEDFLIENLFFPDGCINGIQINKYA